MGDKPVDTAVIMVVGPCVDSTDFKTLEEAIAYDAAGMDVSLIVEKTDGTSAVTAITLTTGGTSDWTHKDGGYYEVEITAAQNIEEGIGYVRGVCTGVLPFESGRYNIVVGNVYDSLTKGTDKLQVDATEISGDSASADNLESDYDGTGYTKANSVVGTCTTVSDKTGFSLSDGGVDAILDEIIEGTHTLRHYMKIFASVLVGKVTGGGSATIIYRDVDDSKNRIVATVTEDGNRTDMTLTED